ncbi:MAG TPA: enoyl-CoA hydratase-related protein [Noviherbaspirillum sp.]|nr:enoyl-CoA hydratase-related protein [Noviherbaspirillum sp.]
MTTRLTIADGLATVVFDDAATLNAMGPKQIADMNRVIAALADDASVRVVLLRAEGPAFGVGGDLRAFNPKTGNAAAALREIGRDLNPMILRLRTLPAIVVAAVHGAVAGGSMGLMCAADIVLVAEGTKFSTAYARIAASPDAGNSWFLPRLVGQRKALEWLLLSDTFDAATAHAFGLVNQVVPAAQLAAESERIVARLLAGPHSSHARIKRLVYQSETTPLPVQLDAEIEHFAQCAEGPDFAEGVAAFVEKRAPRFNRS